MSETVASGGRVWSPFAEANAKLHRVNIWVFIFCIALPFIGLVIAAFCLILVSLPIDSKRPDSIAGGWTLGTISDNSRMIVAISLIVGLAVLLVGLIGLLRYFRITQLLLVLLLALGVPLMSFIILNIAFSIPSEIRAKAGNNGPTFKEWAHDTYGYTLTSSTVQSKDGHEYVEAVDSQGKPTNINVFRDGPNLYLYENTFQLNDTLTKINAEKLAKDGTNK